MKVFHLMKDELGGKIVKEFAALRAKIDSYLRDISDEDKKSKGTRMCVVKRKLKFEDWKHCLEPIQHEKKN